MIQEQNEFGQFQEKISRNQNIKGLVGYSKRSEWAIQRYWVKGRRS